MKLTYAELLLLEMVLRIFDDKEHKELHEKVREEILRQDKEFERIKKWGVRV